MNRLVATGTIALLLSACGTAASSASLGSRPPPASSSPVSGGPSASLASSTNSPPAASAIGPGSAAGGASSSPATQTVQVYFTSGSKLVPEPEQVSTQDPARAALELLIKGPKDATHYSDVPTSTQLQRVSMKNGTALVSFGASFFGSAGSTGTQLRLAQVVYTLTQFPNVTAVQFLQDGQPATVAGGEGFPLNRPLTRKSFPAIQG